eukprot:scaffold77910_cov57-Phaeocystis_antarctica.AAC.2
MASFSVGGKGAQVDGLPCCSSSGHGRDAYDAKARLGGGCTGPTWILARPLRWCVKYRRSLARRRRPAT